MELSTSTSLQNGLMAAGYMLLFLAVLHHPLKHYLAIFVFSSLFACLFNILYDTVVYWRAITSVALIIRVLPPLEACWHIVGKRKDCRLAFLILLTAILLGSAVVTPGALAWGYLTVRTLLTLSVTLVCLMVLAAQYIEPFTVPPFLIQHLYLQSIWMGVHTIFSATASWYNVSWPRRMAARWVYVLAAMVIVLVYQRLLTKSQQALKEPGERS